MELNRRKRTVLLVSSGVVLAATAWGWVLHGQQESRMAEPPAVAAAPPEEAVLDVPPIIKPKNVYRATTWQEAADAARKSIRDPFSADKNPNCPPSMTAKAVPTRHVRHARSTWDPNHVPPPPSGFSDPPIAYAPDQSDVATRYIEPVAEKRERVLSVDDVRLVGLIDDKAIFRVNRNAAEELSVPRSFTLGAGDSFGPLKLDRLSETAATLRDGRKVATKSLERVH